MFVILHHILNKNNPLQKQCLDKNQPKMITFAFNQINRNILIMFTR